MQDILNRNDLCLAIQKKQTTTMPHRNDNHFYHKINKIKTINCKNKIVVKENNS